MVRSMVGIIGIIAFLTILGLSMVITRIASTALSLTGLSREVAKFQARSAFTSTGFTTQEAESVVNHPVRRNIIMWLMVAKSAGMVSIIISLILSFAGSGEHELSRLSRLGWLVTGVALLWIIARSNYLENWMRHMIKKALERWTYLELHDYTELLNLSGEYTVRELRVEEQDWLADKNLGQCRLNEEGVLVLGIYRADGSYVGAPKAVTRIYADDLLILYGRSRTLQNLDNRESGVRGEVEHDEAVHEQKIHNDEQDKKEDEYRREKASS